MLVAGFHDLQLRILDQPRAKAVLHVNQNRSVAP